MKLIRNGLVALSLTAVLPAAHAQVDAGAAQALAEKNLCLACHKVDAKQVGPSFSEVAKKYQGVADAQAKLIANLKKGSKGVWGTTPMPPAKNVPDEDLKTIVVWVLSLGK